MAPKDLSLFAEDANETIRFVRKTKDIATQSIVLIDFSETDYLRAAGVVDLYSEIERIQNQHGVTRVKIAQRIAKQHRDILKESGLLK